MSDVVDFAMILAAAGPVQLATKYGLKKLEAKLKEFSSEPVALSRAIAENYQEWVILLHQWVQYLFEQQQHRAADVNELRAKVEELAENDDTRRILATFAFEAMREALPERKEMLAAAAASLTLLDLPLEEKARCERALRQLDPQHVMQLHGLGRVASKYFAQEEQKGVDRVRHGVWRGFPDREVLVASGCVQINPTNEWGGGGRAGAGTLEITRTGELVLRVLAEYARKAKVLVVPGREPPRDARGEEDARAFVRAEVPELETVLLPLARDRGARYDFPDWGRRNQNVALALAHEPAVLIVEDVSADVAERLRQMKPFHPSKHEQMRLDQRFPEIAVQVSEVDKKHRVLIHGPHDALRFLAEDVDARWLPIPPRS